MEKQLAEVVDGTEIKEITETQNLCSCENDGASNMVSSENNDACGDRLPPFLEIGAFSMLRMQII